MKVYQITTGLLGVNTYFLVNEKTCDAVMIDGGENYSKIADFAKSNGFNIKYELLTHAHFDHAGNARRFQQDGVKIYISELDAFKVKNNQTLSESFTAKFDAFTPDYTFFDGELLNLCGIEIKALSTPGHTDGSFTFIVDDMMFTGDTLFFECIGRTDFPTGSMAQMIKSVKTLYSFDGDFVVYPGHEQTTTLNHERKYNQFIRQ